MNLERVLGLMYVAARNMVAQMPNVPPKIARITRLVAIQAK
jgi:hypothetical protein